MADIANAEEVLFRRSGLDRGDVERVVEDALVGTDDGEMFLEYRQSESFAWDDGRLKSASFDTSQGFGLRAVVGESTGYAHATELSTAAMQRAADAVAAVKSGHSGTAAEPPAGTNRSYYGEDNPLESAAFADKVKILEDIDSYARAKDPRVCQVSASLLSSWQVVEIVRGAGVRAGDIRPLVRLNVQVVVEEADRKESGSYGAGGRTAYEQFIRPDAWRDNVDEALRQALINLESERAPAGEMDVVLGPGWPGILLHEAIGHGLEGDFNRKKTSAFSGLMGQRVAVPGVHVVDDGTLADRRGSLSIDDEGTPSQRTVLIEDGVLVGYMHDRMNARLMGMAPTGNGRRQDFAHSPMPRMTNTMMEAGDRDPAEILESVQDGVYAVSFGGGQVDITSGKFVFSCTEAYRVRDGKVGAPIKGATLIGNGPDVLTRVSAVGNDLKLDSGIGTCGKNGQGVPVGVGQPTMLVRGLTVGGTSALRRSGGQSGIAA